MDKYLWCACFWQSLNLYFPNVLTISLPNFSRDKGGNDAGLMGDSARIGEQRESGRPFTICGERACKCYSTYADCSNHGANLTYVPELPPEISFLNFTHNRALIDHDDFFVNVTKVRHLQIGDNDLLTVSPGAFRVLKKLIILDIGNNKLTYDTLAPALSVKSLVTLIAIGLALGPLPADLFHRYPLPSLKELQFYGNLISTVNMSVFIPLRNMTTLVLGSNPVNDIATAYLPTLVFLDLDNSGLHYFLETCDNHTSLFPSLKTLRFAQNFVELMPENICLPALKELDLSSNQFSELVSDMFNQQRFPSLQSLYLKSLHLHLKGIYSHVFNNSNIRFLDLFGNSIDFSDPTVNVDVFAGCTGLTDLELSRTKFKRISVDRFLALFRPLPSLYNLNLGGCSIQTINETYFSETQTLTLLHLVNNLLDDIPDGTFDHLPNLRSLNLDSNRIRSVRETTFSKVTRQRLYSLGLSNNPFQCDCDLMWFRQWYVTNYSLFHYRWRDPYPCHNLPNATLETFLMREQACLLSHLTCVLIVVCLTILLSVFTLVIVLHRYRWHIRLVLYEAFRGRGDRWRRLQAEHFQFDVFVSFAEEDFHWVSQRLIPELEQKRGLRLCLHQRDFIPGKHIVDNIQHCVDSSKKVLMLFSSSFAKSPWCQFELTLCLTHVMDHDDALVVACLHDIPSRDLTPAMVAVIKTTTYIAWADEPDAIRSFWGRMGIAFREILPVV